MTDDVRRRGLLELAREAIRARLSGDEGPEVLERPHAEEATHGVFVTLKEGGELRGCIGTLAAEEGIARTIAQFACEAAFRDPRFPPLGADELEGIEIEISILTPPRPVRPEEVVPGRDGLILEASGRRGLLLPQVATEWGFSREEFLEALAQKAGLPRLAWRDPSARLWAFEAEVFGESESGPQGGG